MSNLYEFYFRIHHAMDLWRFMDAEKATSLGEAEKACSPGDPHLRMDLLFDLAASEVGHGAAIRYVATRNKFDLQKVISVAEANPSLVTKMAKTSLGVRWIQELIESCKPWPRMIWGLTRALFPGAAQLMMDRHGARLIRYCLARLPSLQKMFIFAAAIQNFSTLATNKKGCMSLIYIINHAPRGTGEHLLEKIASQCVCLAQNPYGNFLVQMIFSIGRKDYEARVCWDVRNLLPQLSTHKFGSFVMEKCLASPSGWFILETLVYQPGLRWIARNKYGNYVVNTALRASEKKPVLHRRLVETLRRHWRSLKRHQYRRHVYRNIV